MKELNNSEINWHNYLKPIYGAPVLSAVRNREASVSRRLTMYYSGSDFNPCHGLCPLYGGCPPLGGSVMGGSTVKLTVISHYV